MLGYYHYGVVLTYLSLVSSVIGISMTLNGRHITLAIVCLMVSGCLDAFDGRVARTRKNATDEEKSFGIQIDSLCDMVCFGVLPACIGFACGLNKWYHIAILALFVLAALIRLDTRFSATVYSPLYSGSICSTAVRPSSATVQR